MARINKKSIITPAVLIILYLIVSLILKTYLPSGKALIDSLSKIYGRFGYEIVIIGSFLESLVLINLFTPGVAAIWLLSSIYGAVKKK